MKKFSIEEIGKIIEEKCYKHILEETCNSWGCVTPHRKEYIEPGELLNELKKIERNKKPRIIPKVPAKDREKLNIGKD